MRLNRCQIIELRKSYYSMNSLRDFVVILRRIHRLCFLDESVSYFENYITYDQVMFLAFDNYKIDNNIDLAPVNRNVRGVSDIRKKLYKKFSIGKKSGGRRIIFSPEPRLKLIQKCINVLLQSVYGSNSSSHGFIWGRSIVTNAKNHIGKKFIFNMDLENFFYSIHQSRIWKRLQYKPFNLIGSNSGYDKLMIANAITNICCYKPDDFDQGILPPGSPTSPILSNIICERLDRRLTGLCRKHNVTYSRYADDITFSSNINVFNNTGVFLIEVERIIHSQNFRINPLKSRLLSNGYRQEVTGVVVNEKLNVRKTFVKSIRTLLFLLEKHGIDKAQLIYNGFDKAKKKNDIPGKDRSDIFSVINGKLNFLKMVKGGNDSTYVTLKSRYDNLISAINISDNS